MKFQSLLLTYFVLATGALALRVESDDDLVSAVAQVLRLRMALAPVTEDSDGLAL